MSELINNRRERMDVLKSMILKINDGVSPENVKNEISSLLKEVPYEDVVAVEQELFEQGVDKDNMLELCDLHSAALNGLIKPSNSGKEPTGHPLSTFKKENQALKREISFIRKTFADISRLDPSENAGELIVKLHSHFNALMDVEKHYLRKENLLFPFLEKYKITGPSTVMWGKDDQVRQMLKNAVARLSESHDITAKKANDLIELALSNAVEAVGEMIIKEEQILFPMSLDTLTENDWFEVYRQTEEIGYCLYSPTDTWRPEGFSIKNAEPAVTSGRIQLPAGSFTLNELTTMLNTMPFDFTFVDKDDYVKFFSEGPDRIFQRNKAILGRKVQFCHPPSSVHTVEKILNDFKSGKQNKADFWINMRGRFIYISYFALRGENNDYLGTLEVTQDLTSLRSLEGERRILSYEENENQMNFMNKEEYNLQQENKERTQSQMNEKPTAAVDIIYDARKDLSEGVHPLAKVMADLETLKGDQKYILITPFTLAPLIEKARQKGFETISNIISPDRVETFFSKADLKN